jgi:hypothetical protein
MNNPLNAEASVELLKHNQEASSNHMNTTEICKDVSDTPGSLFNVSTTSKILESQPPQRVFEYMPDASGPITTLCLSPAVTPCTVNVGSEAMELELCLDKEKSENSTMTYSSIVPDTSQKALIKGHVSQLNDTNHSVPPRKRFSSSYQPDEEATKPNKFQRKDRCLITLNIPAWVNDKDGALIGKQCTML